MTTIGAATALVTLVTAWACRSDGAAEAGRASGVEAVGARLPVASALTRAATAPLCERAGAVNGAAHLNMLTISLHHGSADSGVPHRDEVESTARELAERITAVDELLLVIPAAPYAPDLLRLVSTGQELFQILRDTYHWNVTYRQTNTTALDWNNSAVIAGSAWQISDVAIRDYRGVGVYNYDNLWGVAFPPDGVEGPHFGDFTIRGAGTSFHILTLQTHADDDQKKARQIDHLVDYAAAIGGGEPAFIVGDYNLTRNTALSPTLELAFDRLTSSARLMTWCAEACANLPGISTYPAGEGKLHIAQLGGPTHFAPTGWLVDASSGAASSTEFRFSGLVHIGAGITMTIEPSASERPNTCRAACGEGQVSCRGGCVRLGTANNCTECGDRCVGRCESFERGCVAVGECAPGIECPCSENGCAVSTAQCHTLCLHQPP